MLIPSTLFSEPHFPFLRNVLYCTAEMRKREPINVCFVGQMKYMHHRNKLAGVMHYANRHPEFALQPFDYTQIPPDLCQSLLANMKLDGLIFGDGTALSTFDAYRRAHDVPTVVIIKKRIHLVSRNGKAKTHIVGKWSNDGAGAGAGAHRGIYVTSAAANTLPAEL